MKGIFKKPYRRNLSKTLLIHLFLMASLQLVCLGMILYAYPFWAALGLMCIFLLEGLFFGRQVLGPIAEIEKKIEVLKRESKEDWEEEGELRSFGLLETIQLLLQKESTANIMKKQAEIDALQNQINPHFLYNTLETIRGQAICCGALEIAETTKALADIFRFNISKKGSVIYLQEELANVEAYMKIQKIRFQDRFSMDTQIEASLLQLKIPKLLIQPLVENALKHGLEMKRGKGRIIIRGFRTEDTLFIVVSDDGVGMNTSELKALNQRMAADSQVELVSGNSTNVGLININDRVKMIYGPKHGVTVRSIQNVGTEVTVTVGIL